MKPYYQDNAVTIYHADCREVLPLLTAGSVDLVLTDPPYGVSWNTDSTRFTGGVRPDTRRGNGRSDWGDIRGDDADFDPAPLLVFPNVILWGANHYADKLEPRTWLVWVKKHPELFGTFLSDCEVAWMSKGHGVYAFYKQFPPPSRIAEGAQGKTLHPTQKPEALMQWCMGFYPDAKAIIDPFIGSGSTLRAAKDLGRKAIGIEIEERYCEIAAKRMAQSVMTL